MKTSRYFEFRRRLPDRAWISEEWIQRVMANPMQSDVQMDGRLRLWGRIDEAEGRVLRVVVLEDGETVHNAFFDRGFRG